jgi:flagellar hook assembly protein FlgD
VPSASFVALTIYDAAGRIIETIINKPFTAGHYETEWNASNFSSGTYFYKLEAGNYTETRKMVLVK